MSVKTRELDPIECICVSNLDMFLTKHGFYSDYHERIEALEAGYNTLNLTKKAYGDSYQTSTIDYFSEFNYNKLKGYCDKLNIQMPEYVYGD